MGRPYYQPSYVTESTNLQLMDVFSQIEPCYSFNQTIFIARITNLTIS